MNAIFNSNFPLFIAAANGRSSQSSHTENSRECFRFTEGIVARAIIEGICIDAHMTRSVLKHFLAMPMSLKDLEDVDQQ
jgi:hypothetical protein